MYALIGNTVSSMPPLNQALIDSLNALGEHPDISIFDVSSQTYDITLTWPQRGWIRFTVDIGDGPGTYLIDVVDREGVTYAWKERFLAYLYGNLENVNPAAYM
jgi:hypothetical protein